MNDKNLLIIANSFPNQDDSFAGGIFVKEQINELKHFFNHIYVISPIAHGVSFLRKCELNDYSYDNVSVYFPRYFNIPIFWFIMRSVWAFNESRVIDSLIIKNKIKFDIIHAHFTWPSGVAAVKIKQKYGVPLIITEHTSITFKKAIDKKDATFIKAWKMADKIIRVRSTDIGEFVRLGIPANKVVAIPNGFNGKNFYRLDSVDCRNELDIPQDKKIILNVGNLYGLVKGHKYLIDSISIILENRDDILCVIIGSGKLRSNLEKYVKNKGLTNNIEFVGAKKHNIIPSWINACDLFVLPSLNEGNPTVMFEALGCGKPFVGTKVGGVPEVITSEDYGLLVEPANSKDLADKILISLDREWDRGKILDYASQFTWENISKQIIGVYEQVLKENSE